MNILFITLDQFRADCLSAAGHPIVKTPNLDRLAAQGVRFARHYSQAAPCSPGRASLYTGTYQLNHRVVANGTPLDRRLDNVAKAARRAGYVPTLFGYTDQAVDPRDVSGPDDPRLRSWEGVLPGFDVGLNFATHDPGVWVRWLRGLGHEVPDDYEGAVGGEPGRPAEHSLSAYHTDVLLDWIARQDGPWFAHLSQLRPHPPYGAAGHFARMYDPADMPSPVAPAADRHRLHDGLMRNGLGAPADTAEMAALQAQYFGMVSEVDHQLGRVWAALEASGQWEETFIVVTADHGEQLGDHGLIQKAGFFEQSYHIPAIVRDPRRPNGHGVVVERFTENVDLLPTLCEAMGIAVPAQCDGVPLTPFLEGEQPPWWREAAHWEFDWRVGNIPRGDHPWPWDRRLERQSLAVRRSRDAAYVQFADGSWLCFDLAADPTWRTALADPARVLLEAQAMLTWRAQHADRTLTGMLVQDGGVGRWPEG
ncbi:MAG TPA: sulfatase-like hydrolase/transferase [Phenylobacterium sp.]|nr:sulfatase-like hydrolase/transferase [Phenylobacterium sp.]